MNNPDNKKLTLNNSVLDYQDKAKYAPKQAIKLALLRRTDKKK